MTKRDNPLDRFTEPTPENQAGQTNNRGKPLRVFFLKEAKAARAREGRIGEGSD